ncbi:MAG: molecular chaperone HtpG [Clostridiales bacterium]|nr:molecular chaperone HtpG [Clostridiales bacterium]
MKMKKGEISVKAENILPVIKKWLYSDKDIFLREVVSNASDAIFKFERLVGIGKAEKAENEEYQITVSFNKEKKTLTIADNGIGMTEEEVINYIAQVAFSGAVDFLEKYKDVTDADGIIGHFGLGFYSVFMVADSVEIDTLSYQPDAAPVKWICDGSSSYEIGVGERTTRGTTITLHIGEEGMEFLNEYRLQETLKKYCSFIAYNIILIDENKEKKEEEEPEKPLNDTHPIWLKNPKDCTDEEYKQFYKDVFHDYNDPLFWIHLNVDAPFQLKAVIYFPKLRDNIDLMEYGEIKLYYNQVFVADNIKEILPEFLMVLRGVVDCPDIPINVSRSFLQNDGSVAKISNLIARKVSDKLHSIFTDDREQYNKYWDDIQLLMKYGCIRDSKFFDRMKDAVLFKTVDGEYLTLAEYFDKREDKENKVVYYTDNKAQQAANIELFKSNGLEVVECSHPIDPRFTMEFEMKEEGVKFCCVTAELPDTLTSGQSVNEEDMTALTELFRSALGKENLVVKGEYFKEEKTPAVLTQSEQTKRYQNISRSFGGMTMDFPEEYEIILNLSNPLICKMLSMKQEEDKKDKLAMLCQQIYDISLMSHRELKKEEKEQFIERNYKLFESVL